MAIYQRSIFKSIHTKKRGYDIGYSVNEETVRRSSFYDAAEFDNNPKSIGVETSEIIRAGGCDDNITSNVFASPEPRLSHSCRVKLKDSDMSLCYFMPYGANFGDELGHAVVRRLLEYHFGCSAQDIPAINVAIEKRDGRICLFTLGTVFHMVHRGDHVWGTGYNSKWQNRRGLANLRNKDKSVGKMLTIYSVRGPNTAQRLELLGLVDDDSTKIPLGDPGFLIPFLYSQYYHLRTRPVGD